MAAHRFGDHGIERVDGGIGNRDCQWRIHHHGNPAIHPATQTGPARSALAMFVSGGVIAILLGLSGANWTLVFILIALAGFGFGGQQLVLNYLIAEAYPTQLRATATVWSIGIGRLGSIVGSALGGVLLTGLGSPATSCRWRFRWPLRLSPP